MKSERRHELEHNSLDTELANIWTWLKKNFNRILTVILVLLIVLVAWMWIKRQQESKIIEAQNTLNTLTAEAFQAAPEKKASVVAGLKGLAVECGVDWVSAQAMLMVGLIQADGVINAESIDVKDKAIAEAEGTFQKIVKDYAEYPNFVAAAKVSLGKLAEDKGDFNSAKTYYRAVIDDPNVVGLAVLEIARESLRSLEAHDGEVRLATRQPAWALAAESQPALAPASAPADAPAPETK